MSALKINNLNHKIKNSEILKDISIETEEDKIACILGPSGSGKTTLLKLIAGLEDTQKGEIYIKDKLVSSSKTHVKTEERDILSTLILPTRGIITSPIGDTSIF